MLAGQQTWRGFAQPPGLGVWPLGTPSVENPVFSAHGAQLFSQESTVFWGALLSWKTIMNSFWVCCGYPWRDVQQRVYSVGSIQPLVFQ